jgi:hypothetical protein
MRKLRSRPYWAQFGLFSYFQWMVKAKENTAFLLLATIKRIAF